MSAKDFWAAVRAAILRYNMLPARVRVGVAISGGRDSVVLFDVIRQLREEFHWTLVVLHLNHGLRGVESDGDEQFVANMADQHGIFCVRHRVELARAEGNLEQEARRARRRFFEQARESHQLERVATGHTRSDQAETVLFRLLRGSGTAGLRGILPLTREGVARPLLACSRQAVAAYAAERQLRWREDSSNLDHQFARNRLRHQLLPLLRSEWNPRIEPVLAHTADVARGEEEYWQGEISRIFPILVLKRDCSSIVLDASSLSRYPLALRRRLIRQGIREAGGDAAAACFATVEKINDLLEKPSGATTSPGLCGRVSFGQLRLASRAVASPMPVTIDGMGRFSYGSSTVLLTGEGYNGGELPDTALDCEKLTSSLRLRGWMAGDRYQPTGSNRVRKLHDLFQERRVPYWERAAWPIMVMSDQIVWASRFGAAAQFAASPETRKFLSIREISKDARIVSGE